MSNKLTRNSNKEILDSRGWTDTLNSITYSNASVSEDNRAIVKGQIIDTTVDGRNPRVTTDYNKSDYITNDRRSCF